MHVIMADILEEPKTPRCTHSGHAFLEDHRFVQVDATLSKQTPAGGM
jgi:hypothetical protein